MADKSIEQVRRAAVRARRATAKQSSSALCRWDKGPIPRNQVNVEYHGPDTYGALTSAYCRGVDTASKNPVCPDPLALRILDRFVFDHDRLRTDRMDAILLAQPYRTLLVDRCIEDWLLRHTPNENNRLRHVVELGVGFDARMDRIKVCKEACVAETLMIHEVDNNEVSRVRQDVFADWKQIDSVHWEAFKHIADLTNVVDRRRVFDTISSEVQLLKDDSVTKDFSNVIFVAEGVFYYLGAEYTSDILHSIWARFPGAHVVCDETLGNSGFVGIEKSLGKKRYKEMVLTTHFLRSFIQNENIIQELPLYYRKLVYPFVKNQHNVHWFQLAQKPHSGLYLEDGAAQYRTEYLRAKDSPLRGLPR